MHAARRLPSWRMTPAAPSGLREREPNAEMTPQRRRRFAYRFRLRVGAYGIHSRIASSALAITLRLRGQLPVPLPDRVLDPRDHFPTARGQLPDHSSTLAITSRPRGQLPVLLPDREVGGREFIGIERSTPGSTPGSLSSTRLPPSRPLPDRAVNSRFAQQAPGAIASRPPRTASLSGPANVDKAPVAIMSRADLSRSRSRRACKPAAPEAPRQLPDRPSLTTACGG